jgi:hypothetical protein
MFYSVVFEPMLNRINRSIEKLSPLRGRTGNTLGLLRDSGLIFLIILCSYVFCHYSL